MNLPRFLLLVGLVSAHLISPAARSADEPVPSFNDLVDHIDDLIWKKRVDDLESVITDWRGVNDVLPKSPDGVAKLAAISYAARRYREDKGAKAQRMDATLRLWAKAHPSSSVRRVMEAKHRFASRPEVESLDDRIARIRRAETLLREAEALGGRTADWYSAALFGISASHHTLEDSADTAGYEMPDFLRPRLALIEEGILRYPDYQTLYFSAGENLTSLGFDGSSIEWALHVCELLPEKGYEPYARFIWSMSGVYGERLFSESRYGDWEIAKAGFHDLLASGFNTPRNLNHFLIFARRAEDRATARHLLSIIGDNPDPDTFQIRSRFLEIQSWAESQGPGVLPAWQVTGRSPRGLAWSSDGKTLYAGFEYGRVRAYEAGDGALRNEVKLSSAASHIRALELSTDGRSLVAVSGTELSSRSGTCTVMSSSDLTVMTSFDAKAGPFHAISFSADSLELVCVGGAFGGPAEAWHWSAETGPISLDWATSHKHTFNAVAWSPDSSQIHFDCRRGHVSVIEDAKKIRYVKQMALPTKSNVDEFAYSPDGRWLAAALRVSWEKKDEANGCIAIFDAATMTPREDVLPSVTGGLHSVDFSPDGRFIATVGYDGFVYILKSDTLEMTAWWNANHGVLNRIRWSPDGGSLATAGDAGFVAVWPVDPG